jgi:glycosyltransferase involved in cell wall biosynthesis
VYFDPSSPTEIAKAIYSVLDNDQLRAQLVKKGEENIARFSWEQAGSLTLQLLVETAKTNKDVH